MLTYDVLIPAFNAESTIGSLLQQLSELSGQTPGRIIVVNDGSTDHTAKKCAEFDVCLLNLDANFGKGQALRKGFEVFIKDSSAKYLLCMDADLQHAVDSIQDFVRRGQENVEALIIGKRSRNLREMPLHRILSNSITSMIMSILTGQRISDSQCGFRLIGKNVLEYVVPELEQQGFQLESEFILRTAQKGFRIGFVPIPTIYQNETSSISNFKDTLKFIKLIFRTVFRGL